MIFLLIMLSLDINLINQMFHLYLNDIDGTLGSLLGTLEIVSLSDDDNFDMLIVDGFLVMDNFSLFIDV